ncbi:hypothetical protein ACPPVU_23250 [Mucilaginibacter sp. McL0603]|uniref:hypothetical protein n=1 Tax=Mucilaginibacter sp. McL0603 TaxID=3415670 RepID=UPI003CF2C95C
MDKHLNNGHNEVLWNLLANPADKGRLHASELQQLVNDFPQSGLLHALLSHADTQQNVSHAAAYVNPKTLYILVNSPEILAEVSDKQIIQQLSDQVNYAVVEKAGDLQSEEEQQSNNFSDTVEEENYHPFTETENSIVETNHELKADAIEEPAPVEDTEIIHDEPSLVETEPIHDERAEAEKFPRGESEDVIELTDYKIEAVENTWDEEVTAEAIPDKQEHEEVEQPVNEIEADEQYEQEIIEADTSEYEVIPEAITDEPAKDTLPEESSESPVEEHEAEVTHDIHEDELLTETPSFQLSEQPHSIDDEVFDEITGIENINFVQSAKPLDLVPPPTETPVIDEEELPETVKEPVTEPIVQKERALNMDDEAEKLIIGNIAATDYFRFDRAFTERKQAEPVEKESFVASSDTVKESANTGLILADDNKNVSKYDDDTMPYTFMWWLNKTRKEHSGIYQPFKLDTSQAIRQQGADELQQQYYENIFHLSSVEELDRSMSHPTIEFDPKRKEDRIIKKFIAEEPHISTPSSDKLDTENKAKKSAEDHDELVTETLAHIYVDQMLYHKAINTYKKLMLKFPEKSRYFADQIEQLERKTN